MQVEIIFEDNDIIVCRKPAGMATQTKRLGQQDMESYLKNYRAKKKEQPYIGIVHRLDQPVEGVMVFAKNQKAVASLSKQVQQRIIGKHYSAVCARVENKVEENVKDTKDSPNTKDSQNTKNDNDFGKVVRLTDYMVTDKKRNVSKIVSENTPQAKKAVLDYRIISVDEEEQKAVFDIQLHTGRQHQIRLQLSNIGYPILGDKKYGQAYEGNINIKQLHLCSYRIQFDHPVTKDKMDFRLCPSFLDKPDLLT